MKTLVYIISNINKSAGFEGLALQLSEQKYKIIFILLNPSETHFEKFLVKNKIAVFSICYHSKSDLPKAILSIYKLLRRFKADIVHTHLFDANMAGLIAAKLAGVKKRIHTRHHATFHHEYFPVAVYYDRIINYLSTHIVAPCLNIKEILIKKENVKETKINIVYHGFDIPYFASINEDSYSASYKKYNAENKFPVIGLISRYIELKGIQYIIPAFQNLLKYYPNAYLILANAHGSFQEEIKHMLKELPSNSFCEIKFEQDIASLYHIFDIFVHTPIDYQCEAFGQTYVEALAAGVPSVVTISGIAKEFIIHEKNALVVNYKNSDEITLSIKRLLDDPNLSNKIKTEGKKIVLEKFQFSYMIHSLESIYDQ